MVNIKQKISEINRQPENVRLKYMYIAIFICMILVMTIWIMSVKINFSSNANQKEIQPETTIDSLIKKRIDSQPPIKDMVK